MVGGTGSVLSGPLVKKMIVTYLPLEKTFYDVCEDDS